MTGCSALLLPPAATPTGGMLMPASTPALCLASPVGEECASYAVAQPTGLTPAHGGWMNQPHPNSLQQYRPPGTLGRCSLGLQAHHPPSSGLQFAPHGMRATVASEGAATTATFVPFASSRVTVTKSAPLLPQVPGARLGGPCIPVYRSQAGPVQPLSRIPSQQDYVSHLGYSIGDGMCAAGWHGMLTLTTG